LAQDKLRKARSQRDRAETELRERQTALAKLKELEEESARIRQDIKDREAGLDTHLLALELLESAMAAVRLRAAPALNESLRLAISPVTAGTYREIRLSGDLSAEVFASLKGDFLAPAELSAAVRSGIDLSVAAAMASLLAQSQQEAGHYLLADYTFSLFDRDRLRHVLEGLRGLPGLPQVFAFLQNLPDGLEQIQRWRISEGTIELDRSVGATGAGAPSESPGIVDSAATPVSETPAAEIEDRPGPDTPFGFPEDRDAAQPAEGA
jgi:uncharacterized protein YhaN